MRNAGHVSVAAALLLSTPVSAQEGEIIVTGVRTDSDYYEDGQPVVGLRRRADGAVQSVTIESDSRDADTRSREVYAMLRNAVRAAKGAGLELVYGDYELTRITDANAEDVALGKGNRPDTSMVGFYLRAPLTAGIEDIDARMIRFVKDVPAVGRAQMMSSGDMTLTIVNPDQYRSAIISLVAADGKATAAAFGPSYGVEVEGMDRAIQWSQTGPADVFLYIPYRYTVRPAD